MNSNELILQAFLDRLEKYAEINPDVNPEYGAKDVNQTRGWWDRHMGNHLHKKQIARNKKTLHKHYENWMRDNQKPMSMDEFVGHIEAGKIRDPFKPTSLGKYKIPLMVGAAGLAGLGILHHMKNTPAEQSELQPSF